MKRTGIGCLVLLGISALALITLILYPRFKRIDHPSFSASTNVVFDVSPSPRVVGSAILKNFQNEKTAPAPFDRFNAYGNQDPIFPDDFQIKTSAEKDPALRQYAMVRDKQLDLFLYEPTGDIYWPSEYLYNGRKADFHCGFFLHLSETNGGSQVQILEYQPMIRVGNYFDPLGHAGPGFYWDIRTVEPTMIDRERLKDFILEKFKAISS